MICTLLVSIPFTLANLDHRRNGVDPGTIPTLRPSRSLGVLIGLLAALFGLLVAYFATAVSLAVAGFVGAVVSAVALFAPGVIVTINRLAGTEVVQFGPFGPAVGGFIGLIISLIIAALGLAMLWSGQYLWRGFRFVVNLIVAKTRHIFRPRPAVGQFGDRWSMSRSPGPSRAQ